MSTSLPSPPTIKVLALSSSFHQSLPVLREAPYAVSNWIKPGSCKVKTPAVVMGPPIKFRPLVAPSMLTLVTVPVPVSVTQEGALTPPETRTCPTTPTGVSDICVPLEYATAPAIGDSEAPVPPRPKGSVPWVSVISERSTAGWTWSSRAATFATPAEADPSGEGATDEKLTEKERSSAKLPPPLRPSPAVMTRDSGT